jgi:hypothetical protein
MLQVLPVNAGKGEQQISMQHVEYYLHDEVACQDFLLRLFLLRPILGSSLSFSVMIESLFEKSEKF